MTKDELIEALKSIEGNEEVFIFITGKGRVPVSDVCVNVNDNTITIYPCSANPNTKTNDNA